MPGRVGKEERRFAVAAFRRVLLCINQEAESRAEADFGEYRLRVESDR
jgi:hypothetical protein